MSMFHFFVIEHFVFFSPLSKKLRFVSFLFEIPTKKTFLSISISNWLQSMVVRLDISYKKIFFKHLLLFPSDPHLFFKKQLLSFRFDHFILVNIYFCFVYTYIFL